MSSAASSLTGYYVSWRARKDDDVDACLRLLMRSERILLDRLTFLNLLMTGVVFYESKGPRVHRRGFRTPDRLEGTAGLLTPIPKAFFRT